MKNGYYHYSRLVESAKIGVAKHDKSVMVPSNIARVSSAELG